MPQQTKNAVDLLWIFKLNRRTDDYSVGTLFRLLTMRGACQDDKIDVLNPFMGSGTTALEANLYLSSAYGFATLIARCTVFRSRVRKDRLWRLRKSC